MREVRDDFDNFVAQGPFANEFETGIDRLVRAQPMKRREFRQTVDGWGRQLIKSV